MEIAKRYAWYIVIGVLGLIMLVGCDAPASGPIVTQPDEPTAADRSTSDSVRHIGISPRGGMGICPGGCPGIMIDFNGNIGIGF